MPTKTVIFPKLSKYSNKGFRFLRTDEYLLRQVVLVGVVLISLGQLLFFFDELMEYNSLKKMMTGKSPSINSKFKLTYQFLLKILRNPDHELNKFLSLSLMSKDNEEQIETYKRQLIELKEKHVLNIPSGSEECQGVL